jgi:peptide/nickel transport system permease protein
VKTSAAIVRARLVRSRRAALGLILLGMLALVGTFTEILASPAPIVAVGSGRVLILPGVTHAADYEAMRRDEIDALHLRDVTIWPLIRCGPKARTEAGPNAHASRAHPIGTDAEGRDLAARLLYGARTALGLAFGAVLFGMLLGGAVGGLAGVFRGLWNDALTRLVETVDTFPAIIVVGLVRAIEHEPSALSLVIAVAFVRWAEVARLVRAEVLRASSEEYITAARALGASNLRILWRHLLPNAFGPVLVSSVFGVGSVVLLEAAMSFLSMGAPTRVASWGETLAEGARDPSRLRLIVLPGGLLLLTVGASWLLADALRDAVDPRVLLTRGEPEGGPVSRTNSQPST